MSIHFSGLPLWSGAALWSRKEGKTMEPDRLGFGFEIGHELCGSESVPKTSVYLFIWE